MELFGRALSCACILPQDMRFGHRITLAKPIPMGPMWRVGELFTSSQTTGESPEPLAAAPLVRKSLELSITEHQSPLI